MALSNSFFQSKFDAGIEKKDGQYKLTFQRVKIPLRDVEELGALESIEDGIGRKIDATEDEIIVTATESHELKPFEDLNKETLTEKLIFASNLIHFFANRQPSRDIPSCFPENIYFTPGFQPVFLHYGIKDSLPPTDYSAEEAMQQVKATIAFLFDPSNTFDTYLKFDFDSKAVRFVKNLFRCEDFQSLKRLVEKERIKEIAAERLSVRLPKRKNLAKNGIMIGSIVLLIPLIILTIYAFIIQMPRENLFQQSHEFFLESQYSNVVTSLNSVSYNSMPKVVQYELAVSYVKNEALTAAQQSNILNNVTLQSNLLYYQYWIQTGRGDTSGALNTARSLNDRMLIAYALLKEKAAVQANLSISGQTKQTRLQSIDSELKQYSDLMKSSSSSPVNSTTNTGSNSGTSGSSVTNADVTGNGSSQGISTGSSTGSSSGPSGSSQSQKKSGASSGSSGGK